MDAPTNLDTFIRNLPKAELHLHLEGTIEPATLVELSQRTDATPITRAEAEALYQYTDFSGFLLAFKAVCARLAGPAEYELAAWRMLQSLAKQGVVHAEVYISVGVVYYWRKAEDAANPRLFEEIFDGLERARIRAERELGLTLYWIYDAVRHFPVPDGERVFRLAIKLKEEFPSIIAIGLGGDERVTTSEPYRAIYADAKAAGLRLTNHAGETTGPEAIREAISIGSERLGHVLSAGRDLSLIEELRETQIPLELNPTSNVRTGVCPAWPDHPLRAYFDAGLFVTLNSDDPAFFGSTLENEYRLAAQHQHFTPAELAQLAANSFRASFLPDTEKKRHLQNLHDFVSSSNLSTFGS